MYVIESSMIIITMVYLHLFYDLPTPYAAPCAHHPRYGLLCIGGVGEPHKGVGSDPPLDRSSQVRQPGSVRENKKGSDRGEIYMETRGNGVYSVTYMLPYLS